MTIDDLIKTIETRGNLNLSPGERNTLRKAPKDSLKAQKILAADAFNRGHTGAAVAYCKRAFALAATAENEQNLISALMRDRQIEEAKALCLAPDCQLTEIMRAARMGELSVMGGDRPAAVSWGQKALKLKDQDIPKAAQADTIRHVFDPTRPEQNIIAFSLFGNGARYIEGALRNALVARYLYPGWTPRFYIDESVPREAVNALREQGAQLRKVGNMPTNRFGLFWRFLVEDDPEVTHYIVRDADSVINVKERVAVQQWLDSAEPFHVIRDFPSHSELILAGMWGAQRGNLPDMGKRILAYDKAQAKTLNSRTSDQMFLREDIWPHMRGRVCVHDPVFGYGATHKTPGAYDLPANMHIGQNDAAVRPAGK